MAPQVEKKSRVRKRHKSAIEAYEAWLLENPAAKKKKKLQMFDLFVDSAALNEAVNGTH